MKRATEYSREEEKERNNRLIYELSELLQITIEPIRKEDIDFFRAVEKREPSGLIGVTKRCSRGYPVVFVSQPILNHGYFPTMFWLTCPYLVRACGKLESLGYHTQIEEEIEVKPRLKQALIQAQEQMKNVRKLVTEITGIKVPDRVLKAFIAGSSSATHLKCLHAHLAAYLSGINTPAGEKVLEAIEKLECSTDCLAEK